MEKLEAILTEEQIENIKFYIRGEDWDVFMELLSEANTPETALETVKYTTMLHGCYTIAFCHSDQ